MAADMVLGEVVPRLVDLVMDMQEKARAFRSVLQELAKTLETMKPEVERMLAYNALLDRRKQDFTDFGKRLVEGESLVKKCKKVRCWEVWKKVSYTTDLRELNSDIEKFINDMRPELMADVRENLVLTKEIHAHVVQTKVGVPSAVPGAPLFAVGLKRPVKELKDLILNNKGVAVIGVYAYGGFGKTTLVRQLCNDKEILEIFKKNIFYVTVSQKTDRMSIANKILQGRQPINFDNDSEALNQLEQMFRQIQSNDSNPILLVLDDVWSEVGHIVQDFKFNLSDYKLVVTSSSKLPSFDFPYALQPLNKENSKALFRHFACPEEATSSHKGISYMPNESMVNEVVEFCKGNPLLLQTVAMSLRGQPSETWQNRIKKWSKGVSILESNRHVLDRLKQCLDALLPEDDVQLKECFMDLGSFPEEERVPTLAFVDMWEELYGLDEADGDAIAILHKLCSQNLATLIKTRSNASKDHVDEFGLYSEFVTQHNTIRQLARHESKAGTTEQRKRLLLDMKVKEEPHPNAKLVSITTDEKFTSSWGDLEIPEAEVLILNLRSKQYTLPEFVEKMNKLKVVIVTNYGVFPAVLSNFVLLGLLANLRRLRLEHISIPSLSSSHIHLKNLRKLSLVMCNINEAFKDISTKGSDVFPKLTEIIIDYCNDLVEIPELFCDIININKLSITNCHKLSALPNGIGNLVNLEVLRLHDCTKLSELPASFECLENLKYLDICSCLSLKKLPEGIGKLCNLKKLNMRGCSELLELPETVMNLQELEEVICDEAAKYLWDIYKDFLFKLEIKVFTEDVNLNWLPSFNS